MGIAVWVAVRTGVRLIVGVKVGVCEKIAAMVLNTGTIDVRSAEGPAVSIHWRKEMGVAEGEAVIIHFLKYIGVREGDAVCIQRYQAPWVWVGVAVAVTTARAGEWTDRRTAKKKR